MEPAIDLCSLAADGIAIPLPVASPEARRSLERHSERCSLPMAHQLLKGCLYEEICEDPCYLRILIQ